MHCARASERSPSAMPWPLYVPVFYGSRGTCVARVAVSWTISLEPICARKRAPWINNRSALSRAADVPDLSQNLSCVELDAKKVDAILAGVDQCRLPGAAVGIAIGGKPVYRRGFGLANMELPVVLSPTIRMRIGSISKHFTSLAYMLLCE